MHVPPIPTPHALTDGSTAPLAMQEYDVIKDRLNDMGLKTVIMIPPEEGWHLTPTENL